MKKFTKILSLFCVVGLALMLAACAKKTEAPANTTATPVTTTANPQTQAPTTTTKPATQAPVTTTKAPATTVAPATSAPVTTTQAQSLTYTVTLEDALPYGRTILVWAWNSDGSVGYVPDISGLTLTFTADSAIDGANIVVLKEGQTSLGEDWINRDYQSPNLTFTDNAATWNNHVSNEDITYTITLAYEIEGRTILVYAWNETGNGEVLNPTVNVTTLTFTSKAEFTKAIVVVLKEGETELGQDWANKDIQSPELDLVNHAATYTNDAPAQDITYTINLAYEITGKNILIYAWNDSHADFFSPVIYEKTLTFTSKVEFTKAIVVVLKDGETEIGQDWANKEYQSGDLDLVDHAATYDNTPVIPEEITYTITLAYEITGRTILIHAWNNEGGSPMITPTVNATTLTFTSDVEYTGCIVVVLKEGQTEVGDEWVNKDYQSPDLTFADHAASYANEAPAQPITYTITTSVEITRTVYVLLWDGEQTTPQYTTKATVTGTTITCVGYREYNVALIFVLQEGETEVNNSCSNVDYESPSIGLSNHAGIYDNSSVQEIAYTITFTGTLPEGRTIVVWAWDAGGFSGEFAATVEGKTITFKSVTELKGCLIVLLKEGETEFNADWDHKKDKQSNDLTITDHAATWDGSWKN